MSDFGSDLVLPVYIAYCLRRKIVDCWVMGLCVGLTTGYAGSAGTLRGFFLNLRTCPFDRNMSQFGCEEKNRRVAYGS